MPSIPAGLQALLDKEFRLRPEVIHLNHAAVAPWPARTQRAVSEFARENVEQGSLAYPRWLETEVRLREQGATLLNAPGADDIALLKSTSEALSVVAHGLGWSPGDKVVIPQSEFPSNRIVWESLARYGVHVEQVDIEASDAPEEALMAAVDAQTRLLAVSSVQYASGLRLDLARLGAACSARGVLFCVDAIQSIGALQTDVQAWNADFVMADGHKWMLGPEGLALFYCRPALRDQLHLHQYGWHMVEHAHDFERRDWTPAASARRFECGSPNMLGIHALSASLSLLLEVGMETVEARLVANAGWLLQAIGDKPDLALITPATPGRHAGIVTFCHRRVPAERLYRHLTDHGVLCAMRGGGVRFSPHFHTDPAVLERAVELAASCPD